MIGNAVPVNLAYEIALGIKRALQGSKNPQKSKVVISQPRAVEQLQIF